MLKLHGFAVSNYFNMVRMALDAKGLDYELIQQFPAQTDEWLALSPVGKVPCLETSHGTLSETIVILEYLDEAYPAHPIFPADPFERAQVRQVMHMLKLYIELPARRLFPGVFFGAENAAHTIEEVKPVIERGVTALNALGKFDPYLMGSAPTAADYMFMFSFDLATAVCKQVYDWDLLAAVPEAGTLLTTLNAHPAAQEINAIKQKEMAAFVKMRAGS